MDTFLIMSTAIFVGSIMLWLSGYYLGISQSSSTTGDNSLKDNVLNSALAEISSLKKKNIQYQKEISIFKEHKDDGLNRDHIDEVAKLTSEIAKVEGEKDKAQFENDTLKDEIEDLKKLLKSKNKKPKLPPPTLAPKPSTESEVFDDIQAQLDMEKVAHQKTKEELEQVKKLAAVKMASTPSFKTSGSSGGKSKFQTMAFNVKAQGASGDKTLGAALSKIQSEKDKLQSELQRVKKELQLLKIRNK